MDKQQLAVAGAAATAGALVCTCAWSLSAQKSPDRSGNTIETTLWDPEQQSSHSSPSLLDSDQPSPIPRTIHASLHCLPRSLVRVDVKAPLSIKRVTCRSNQDIHVDIVG